MSCVNQVVVYGPILQVIVGLYLGYIVDESRNLQNTPHTFKETRIINQSYNKEIKAFNKEIKAFNCYNNHTKSGQSEKRSLLWFVFIIMYLGMLQ